MLQETALKTLRRSPRNVRKKKSSKSSIKALAASIKTMGVLENLIVTQLDGGTYAVEAGERRLTELELLLSAGDITEDYPVPVRVITVDALAVSLAENFHNEPMHPVDEFEAFSALHRSEKMGSKAIAIAFGQSERYVEQRLRLSAIHPTLRSACRNGQMTIDCLEAFTVSDDKTRQKDVWDNVKDGHFNARSIRQALTQEKVPSTHKLARFVGLASYQKAGGGVSTDLFDDVSYLEDPTLLSQLADQKLNREAKKLTGWKWVKTSIDADWSFIHQCGRVGRVDTDESKRLQAEYDLLDKEYEEIDATPYDDITDQQANRLNELEDKLSELEDRIEEAKAVSEEDRAIAGCFISISNDGAIDVHTGLMHPDDIKQRAKRKNETTQETEEISEDSLPAFSQSLISDLQRYRLAITKHYLATSFNCAFDLMITSMLVSLCREEFVHWHSRPLSANFDNTHQDTSRKDIEALDCFGAMQKLKDKLLKNIPRDGDDEALFEAVAALTPKQKQDLFAFLVSLTVVKPSGTIGEGVLGVVEKTLSVSMREYWTPTADNLFSRVGKDTVQAWLADLMPDCGEVTANATRKELAGTLEQFFRESNDSLSTKQLKHRDSWLPECLLLDQ